MLTTACAIILFSSPLALNSIQEKKHYIFSNEIIESTKFEGISKDRRLVAISFKFKESIKRDVLSSLHEDTYYVFADGDTYIPSEWGVTLNSIPKWARASNDPTSKENLS